MARPVKQDDVKKRIPRQFRLTEAEDIKLRKLAADEGLSVTDYFKLKTMGVDPKRRKATPEREILIRGLGDLGRIRDNINAIARGVNSLEDVPTDNLRDRFSDALFEISELSKRIINTLENGY